MLQNLKNLFKLFSLPIRKKKTPSEFVKKFNPGFFSHIFNLDLKIGTLIYIGEDKSLFRHLCGFLPTSNSFFMDSNNGAVLLNLYTETYLEKLSQGFPDNKNTFTNYKKPDSKFNIEEHCLNLNFDGPYFLFSELTEELIQILNESNLILKEIEVIVVSLNIKEVDHNSKIFPIQHYLHQNGFSLFDVVNKSKNKEGYTGDKLFIFSRNESRLYISNRIGRKKKSKVNDNISNCLIAGSGRSGTSMLGGILYEAGYYMGENLFIGSDTNPKGFFESHMINYLNEDILSKYKNIYSDYVKNSFYGEFTNLLNLNYLLNPKNYKGQGWLSSLPAELTVDHTDPDIDRRIKELTGRVPFCYKDPRFSYTLPVWNKYLDDKTVIICVFRDPGTTVMSIIKEQKNAEYLRDLKINEKIAYEVYFNIYSHIIKNYERINNNIIFIHYEQILNGTAIPRLSELLNVQLTNNFADKNLKRSNKMHNVPVKVNALYEELCKRADYQLNDEI